MYTTFSQRIGKKPVRDVIQIEGIDETLANLLWNNIINDFVNKIDEMYYSNEVSDLEALCKIIWELFFKFRTDEIPKYRNDDSINVPEVFVHLKNWYLSAEWYEKYDLIEFLSRIDKSFEYSTGFIEACNFTLVNELSGYRIIKHHIVQVASDEELQAIEDALTTTTEKKSVNLHLSKALEHLSNRHSPDYRNSIKESISAVESMCKIITGNDKATLGQALIELEKNQKIHGALKSAFTSLYGYTSDTSGIRHSLLENSEPITLDNAKFMLVVCSAFINYLLVNNK